MDVAFFTLFVVENTLLRDAALFTLFVVVFTLSQICSIFCLVCGSFYLVFIHIKMCQMYGKIAIYGPCDAPFLGHYKCDRFFF